jgi:hypothetical protein
MSTFLGLVVFNDLKLDAFVRIVEIVHDLQLSM